MAMISVRTISGLYNGFLIVTEKGYGMTASWLELVRKNDSNLVKLCRVDTFRGSGRGGQKRNKTSNAVRLTLRDLVVTESASRSKAQNITLALKKLRLAIALNTIQRNIVCPPFPEEIQPYLHQSTIRINSQNPALPIFLGCLLDLFLKKSGNWAEISSLCGVTNTQLRRFVEKHVALRLALDKVRRQSADNEGISAEEAQKEP